ncbi:DUF2987 domain-containing protein [Shewanella sedimentimangrovi]|uniref:DUF2987 domain-containing protein n=1 Tax=Shewanella sedimentimangrovi TaxID=2814293 RepID=A0ABX7R724_9GAMM|nr:DUF2987 domain-containing protein [Shewanella sedimentimangrovi]QSX38880.1 DUF2987 domain-containing protein [Shewanella sedimentimangrovi]
MNKALLFSLLFTPALMAETVSLEYKEFYERLNVVNKSGVQLVELTFSVAPADKCPLEGGQITSGSQSYPLTISRDQRLLLPFDEQLKLDRALIQLTISGEENRCGLAMQLRERQPMMNYSAERLTQLLTEMDKVLDNMQGFPLKYFRKPIDGLSFEFVDDGAMVILDGVSKAAGSKFTLSKEDLAQVKIVQFSQVPKVVSPWINQ